MTRPVLTRPVRVALPLLAVLPLFAGCDLNERPATATASTAATATPSPSPTPVKVVGKKQLKRALLPPSQLPGYKKEPDGPDGPDEQYGMEEITSFDATDLMPIKGVPKRCRTRHGGGLMDTSQLTPDVQRAPSVNVAYEGKSVFFSEGLTWLPAGTPMGIVRFRVPPGCARQDGRVEGDPAHVLVRVLGPADLPKVGNAEVTGLQVELRSDLVTASIRLVQLRAGQLLMVATTGSMNGTGAAVADRPIGKAWTYALKRLG